MKVTVTKNLNIRSGSPYITDTNNPGYYLPGTVIDTDGVVAGQNIEGNGAWHKIKDSTNYVWSGGTNGKYFDPTKISWAFENPDGIDILTFWNNTNLLGQNIRVAVIDSGINTSIKDIIDAIKDNLDTKSFIDTDPSIEDELGHGTSCASILASRGYQMYGTAPSCELIIAKIRNKSVGATNDAILKALKWACEERNADIISMSFTAIVPDTDISNYITNAFTKNNKIFIAAVGDLGSVGKDVPAYPANYSNCLSIGAYDTGRVISPISSWNTDISFVVPGNNLKGYILSGALNTLPAATSYACPFAAGLLANLLSYYKGNNQKFTASSFVNLLSYDQPPIVATNLQLIYGKGILNIANSYKNLIS